MTRSASMPRRECGGRCALTASPRVRILDGGLPRWIKEGRPLETGDAHPKPRVFTPRLEDSFVASLDEVRAALASGSAQVVDARPAERFRGTVPEPRANVKSGRMPGSLNLPFVEIVEHGSLKAPDALKAVFAEHKIDLERPIITTCGSGVTAAILALAVEEAGGRSRASTTARGPSGARAPTARSSRGRNEARLPRLRSNTTQRANRSQLNAHKRL